jgi:hypothetical protein
MITTIIVTKKESGQHVTDAEIQRELVDSSCQGLSASEAHPVEQVNVSTFDTVTKGRDSLMVRGRLGDTWPGLQS